MRKDWTGDSNFPVSIYFKKLFFFHMYPSFAFITLQLKERRQGRGDHVQLFRCSPDTPEEQHGPGIGAGGWVREGEQADTLGEEHEGGTMPELITQCTHSA
jgi:hypothetical protein